MPDQNLLSNNGYITSSDAALLYRCSKDYISRLCREGKLKGVLVGRNWFIERESFEKFLGQKDVVKTEALQKLAEVRKQEYLTAQKKREQVEAPSVEILKTEIVKEVAVEPVAVVEMADELVKEENVEVVEETLEPVQKGEVAEVEIKVKELPASRVVSPYVTRTQVALSAVPFQKVATFMLATTFVFGSYALLQSSYPKDAAKALSSAAHESYALIQGDSKSLQELSSISGASHLAASLASVSSARSDFFGRRPDTTGSLFARAYTNATRSLSVAFGFFAAPSSTDVLTLAALPKTNTPVVAQPAQVPATQNSVIAVANTQPRSSAASPITILKTSPSDVSREYVDTQLQILKNSLSSEIYKYSSQLMPGVSQAQVTLAQATRIDRLSRTTLEASTFNNGTINETAINGGSISGTSIGATSLSVSGTASFAGGVTFSGGTLDLPFFNANSTTTASTIAYRLGIGTTSPYRALSVGGDAVFGGDLLAGTLTATSSITGAALVINGNATTTGNGVFQGNLRIADSATPNTGTLYFGTGNASINHNSSDFMFTTGSIYTAAGRIVSQGDSETLGLGVRYASSLGTYFLGASNAANPDLIFTNNSNVERARLTDAGFFGIGTTSPSERLAVGGNGLVSGNLSVGGDLFVAGNSTTVGNSSSNTLTVNASINSNIVPDQNITRDLGSPSYYWRNVYVGNIVANSISAASTTIAGTASQTFTINSDNVTSDTEDADLIFFRGNVVPNALLSWKTGAKRFELNQPIFIQNADTTNLTGVTLSLKGQSGQTGNLFAVASSTGTNLFNITSAGLVGVGTTSPSATLAVSGNTFTSGNSTTSGSAYFDGNVGIGGNTFSQSGNFFNLTTTNQNISLTAGGGQGVFFGTNGTPQTWGILSSTNAFRPGTDNVYDIGSLSNRVANLYIGTSATLAAATSTSFAISNIGSGSILKTTTGGAIIPAVAGIDFVTGAGLAGAYLFPLAGNATSTLTQFNGGLTAFASSTIGNGNQNGGLTINGGATTTGNAYIAGNVGIGTNAPVSKVEINAGTLTIRNDAGDATPVALSILNAGGGAATGAQINFPNSSFIRSRYANGFDINATDGTNLNIGSSRAVLAGNQLTFDTSTGVTIFSGAGSGNTMTFKSPGSLFFNSYDNANGFLDRMVMLQNGNFGVGTVTPDAKLVINNGLYDPPGQALFKVASSTANATTTFFTINNIGNVGIGTSSPSAGLAVVSDAAIRFAVEPSSGSATRDIEVDSSGNISFGYIYKPTDGFSLRILKTSSGLIQIGSGNLQFMDNNGSAVLIKDQGNNALISNGWDGVNGFKAFGYGNNKLYFNNLGAENKIGIGTSTPWAKFSLVATGGGSSAPLFTVASSTNGLATSTAFHITSNGFVGIGTIIPGAALSFGSDLNEKVRLYDSGAANTSYGFGIASNDFRTFLGNGGSGFFTWRTGGYSGTNEIMRLTGVGNLGIGTTSPWARLSVEGTSSLGNQAIAGFFTATSTTASTFAGGFASFASTTIGDGTQAGGLTINGGATTTGNAYIVGNIGIGTTTPTSAINIFRSGADAGIVLRTANTATDPSVTYSNTTNTFKHILTTNTFKLTDGGSGRYYQVTTAGVHSFFSGLNNEVLTINLGKVGIGTTSPAYALSVEGSSTLGNQAIAGFFTATSTTASTFAGSVGIGTTSPFRKFDVVGGNMGLTNAGASNFTVNDTTNSIQVAMGVSSLLRGFVGTISNHELDFRTDNTVRMLIDTAGQVGIGTTTPSFLLDAYKSANNGQRISITNPNGGSGAFAGLSAFNGDASAANGVHLYAVGTGYTTSGAFVQDGAALFSDTNLAGGLSIASRGASAAMRFYTGGVADANERMRIDAAGNIGIGTTSPWAKLSINANNGDTNTTLFAIASSTASATTTLFSVNNVGVVQIKGNGTGFAQIGDNGFGSAIVLNGSALSGTNYNFYSSISDTRLLINRPAARDIIFSENNTFQMVLQGTTGNLGVGTSSPYAKLSVKGAGSTTGVNFQTTNSSDSPLFTILDSGLVGIGTTSPSATLTVAQPNVSTSGLYLQGFANNNQPVLKIAGGNSPNSDLVSVVSNTGSPYLTVSNAGFVGIGSSTPYAKLSITATTNSTAPVFTATGFDNDNQYTPFGLFDEASQPTFVVYQKGVVNALGNIGIGTSTPVNRLTVNFGSSGAVSPDGILINDEDAGSSWSTSASNAFLDFGSGDGSGVGIGTRIRLGTVMESTNGGSSRFGIFTAPTTASTMVERFSILSGGNVGIGTTTPIGKLHVSSGWSGQAVPNGNMNTLVLESSADAGLSILTPNNRVAHLAFGDPENAISGRITYAHTTDAMGFYTAGSERLSIVGGNVGVGTTSPWAKLSVEGISSLGNQAIAGFFTATSTTASSFAGGFTAFASTTIGNGTQAGGLTINGNATTTGNAYFADGSAATPSISLSSDSALGFYKVSSNTIGYSSAGSLRFQFAGGTFSGATSAGPALLNLGASATSPNIVPNRADTTTGFNSGTLGNINVIVGGAEVSRWTSTGFGIGTTTPSQALSVNGTIYTNTGIRFPDGSVQTAAAAAGNSGTAGQIAYYASAGTTVSATSSIFLTPTGNFGVGTTTPRGTLEIVDTNTPSDNATAVLSVHARGNTPYLAAFFNDAQSKVVPGLQFFTFASTGAGGQTGLVPGDTTISNVGASKLSFATNGYTNPRLTITGTGLVGIGTTSPTQSLLTVATPFGATGSLSSLFRIASSTPTATTTLFDVNNQGDVTITGANGATSAAASPVAGFIASMAGTNFNVSASGVSISRAGTSNGSQLLLQGNQNALASGNYAGLLINTGISSTAGAGSFAALRINPTITVAQASGTGLNYLIASYDGTTASTSRGFYQMAGVGQFANNIGVGSTSPYAKLSVHAQNGDLNTTLFAIASSTASATTTLFTVDNVGNAYHSGNLGIGTTSTNAKLVVQGGTGAGVVNIGQLSGNSNFSGIGFTLNASAALSLSNYSLLGDSNNTYLNRSTGGAIFFRENNTDQVTIATGGNVGIGTTSPLAKFAVDNGLSAVNQDGLFVISSVNSGYNLLRAYSNWTDGSGGNLLSISNASGNAITVNNSRNVGIGVPSPAEILDIALGQNATSSIKLRNSNSGANASARLALGNDSDAQDGFLQLNSSANTSYGGSRSLNLIANAGAIAFVNGYNNPTPAMLINTSGNVGIGNTAPASLLQVGNGYNTSFYTIRSGDFVLQPYAHNNGFIADNSYYNGSAFTRIGNGYASLFQFFNGQILFRGADTGSGTFTGTLPLKTDFSNSGTVALGGSINVNPNNYTGATMVVLGTGNVGIGTTSPFRKLSITDPVATAQMTVAYDTSRYTDFLTSSVGDLTIAPQGQDIFTNDSNLWVCTGGSCPSGTPAGTGNIIVENKIGIGTTTPGYLLTVNAINATDNLFQVASTTNQSIFVVNATGKVGVGTSTPTQQFSIADRLFVGAGGASGMGTATSTFQGDVKITGKLDVGTIDPVYTIDGVKYATYGHSTIGVKEEAVEVFDLATLNPKTGKYEKKISFRDLKEGSDLWLFYQVTDFGDDWKNLVITLTASFDGTVFYKKIPNEAAVIISASEAGEVSARFIANRFDSDKWPNVRPDQDGEYKGHELETTGGQGRAKGSVQAPVGANPEAQLLNSVSF